MITVLLLLAALGMGVLLCAAACAALAWALVRVLAEKTRREEQLLDRLGCFNQQLYHQQRLELRAQELQRQYAAAAVNAGDPPLNRAPAEGEELVGTIAGNAPRGIR